MPIPRTPMVDDDGSGTTGTIINNAWKQEFYNQIDAALVSVIGFPDTGTVHDWNPNLATKGAHVFVEWYGASDLMLTGMAGGSRGQIVTFKNVAAAGILWFPRTNPGSAGPNRWFNLVMSSATPVAPGGWIQYVYDGNIWVLTGHEQGGWIDVPFAASNFAGTNSLIWTVASNNVGANKYRVQGRTLQWHLFTANSTLSGVTNANSLMCTVPNGYALKPQGGSQVHLGSGWTNDGGYKMVLPVWNGTTTQVVIIKSDASNFGLQSTLLLQFRAEMEID